MTIDIDILQTLISLIIGWIAKALHIQINTPTKP